MNKRRKMRWSPRGRPPRASGQGRGPGRTLRPAGDPARGVAPQVFATPILGPLSEPPRSCPTWDKPAEPGAEPGATASDAPKDRLGQRRLPEPVRGARRLRLSGRKVAP